MWDEVNEAAFHYKKGFTLILLSLPQISTPLKSDQSNVLENVSDQSSLLLTANKKK